VRKVAGLTRARFTPPAHPACRPAGAATGGSRASALPAAPRSGGCGSIRRVTWPLRAVTRTCRRAVLCDRKEETRRQSPLEKCNERVAISQTDDGVCKVTKAICFKSMWIVDIICESLQYLREKQN